MGATPVCASLGAAGDVLTVGTGLRLHITHVAVRCAGSTSLGRATVTADVEDLADDTVVLEAPNAASATAAPTVVSLSRLDLRVIGGKKVKLVNNGLTAASFGCTVIGYTEAAP